ncbi:RidA family protein [Amycolatopsis panacis]|uniref:RidA family protein n=1 Tax=Amycolatopsis panacis TaxID=2340917 RepID=A0A419I2D2_9PSEU|nr:RidA family protein [Amycolatopsis panacis]RJQ84060.1 RidA family protein [Amycolatopsis panacis]
MAVTLVSPGGLPKVDLYRQVSVGTGSRFVFVAGQVACDADGKLVGEGDFAAQVEQCYLNVATALAEAGAKFSDVVRLTCYLVDWTPDKMSGFQKGLERAAAKLGYLPQAPFTGIGVAALAEPGLLVELEATAILD